MKVPVLNKYTYTESAFIERRLPTAGSLYVKKGDRVNSFDQVGQASFVKDEEKISFEGKPIKEEGDRVYPGDIVAVNKTFIFKKKEYTTTISGRIKEINIVNKYVLVEGLSRRYNLISGVNGEVVDTLNNQSVLIKTEALIINCAAGAGEEVAGELIYIAGQNGIVTEKDITPLVAGKILVASRIESGALRKAKTLEALGFIIGGCDYIDYKKFIEDKINVLITEGFGKISFGENLQKYFASLKSKFGILRTYDTMLLIPAEKNAPIIKDVKSNLFMADVKVGDFVQVFSSKHYGFMGNVLEVKDSEDLVVIKIGDENIEVPSQKIGLVV